MEKNLLNDQESEKVAFVKDYKDLIIETNLLLKTLNKIQQLLKNNGFNDLTLCKCVKLLENINGERGLKIKEEVC
ncbi:MAG: hypothetical protein GZ091_12160 [Paludibacter sp.]|nr:hypothetical protein [Paludibacter sp.]